MPDGCQWQVVKLRSISAREEQKDSTASTSPRRSACHKRDEIYRSLSQIIFTHRALPRMGVRGDPDTVNVSALTISCLFSHQIKETIQSARGTSRQSVHRHRVFRCCMAPLQKLNLDRFLLGCIFTDIRSAVLVCGGPRIYRCCPILWLVRRHLQPGNALTFDKSAWCDDCTTVQLGFVSMTVTYESDREYISNILRVATV